MHTFRYSDILVFMPGQEDIEVTCELLGGKCTPLGILIHWCSCQDRKILK